MLPLTLDLTRLQLALVGNGAAAVRRLHLLEESGARDIRVFADEPSPALIEAAGSRLTRRLPSVQELAAVRLVFFSERAAPYCRDLVATTRAAGTLVHVEDEPSLSDMHVPAVLRRGALSVAVATDGKSPGLAAQMKHFLARVFGPEWGDHLDDLTALRHGWRDGGADPETVARWTEEWITRQGWLPADTVRTLADLRSTMATRFLGV